MYTIDLKSENFISKCGYILKYCQKSLGGTFPYKNTKSEKHYALSDSIFWGNKILYTTTLLWSEMFIKMLFIDCGSRPVMMKLDRIQNKCQFKTERLTSFLICHDRSKYIFSINSSSLGFIFIFLNNFGRSFHIIKFHTLSHHKPLFVCFFKIFFINIFDK